jgi:hypothetical protein
MYLVNTWSKAFLRKIHTSDGFFWLAMRRSLKTCVALLWGSNIISPKVQIDALTFACTFSRKKHISWVSMEARDDKNATTTLGKTKASQTDHTVSPAIPQVLEFFNNVRDGGLLGLIAREMPQQQTGNVLQ